MLTRLQCNVNWCHPLFLPILYSTNMMFEFSLFMCKNVLVVLSINECQNVNILFSISKKLAILIIPD